MTVIQKAAPRKAPAVTIRFRSKVELEKVKRAARIQGLSLNTFVIGRASVAAHEVILQSQAEPSPATPGLL
jgi:uncharacterized protein (DUF1778 family)